MIRKLVGLLSLLAFPLLMSSPTDAKADCRRAVVVNRQVVAVETALVAVPVPLFASGYAAGSGYSYTPQAQTLQGSKSDYQLLLEAVKALTAEVRALRGEKPAPVQGKLSFLSDAARCGKCHTGPAAKGKLDLSKGLEGLDARQLGLLTIVTADPKAEDAMPPPNSKVEPLKDEEYSELRAQVTPLLKAASK